MSIASISKSGARPGSARRSETDRLAGNRAPGPGAATASGLAWRLGLNSGATSYHLRQLAEYGLIEPATELGNKRERWWRARHETTIYDPAELEGDSQEAGLAMVRAVLSQHAAMMQRALAEFPQQPQEWRQASNASDYTFVMTAEQALALKEKMTGLLREEMRRSPPPDAPNPEGARRFTVLFHAFPFPGLGGAGDDEGAG